MSPGFKSRLLGAQSDERLVALVRSGHEPAFEALVHRYRRPLLRYCRRICGSEARAEEALQQTLTNAWIALRRQSEVRDVRPWLYRVAHNAALNAIRAERAIHVETLAVGELERAFARTPRAGAPSIEDTLALRDALAGVAALPRMQREAMVRTAVAGHSHEEVASALGISDGAVRGLLYRARASMRAAVSAFTPAPALAWAAGGGGAATGGIGGQRIAELAGGGGAAGLSGLMAKGGAIAVTAGIAITGSVLAGSHAHAGRPAHARHELASTQAPPAALAQGSAGAVPGTWARIGAGGRTPFSAARPRPPAHGLAPSPRASEDSGPARRSDGERSSSVGDTAGTGRSSDGARQLSISGGRAGDGGGTDGGRSGSGDSSSPEGSALQQSLSGGEAQETQRLESRESSSHDGGGTALSDGGSGSTDGGPLESAIQQSGSSSDGG